MNKIIEDYKKIVAGNKAGKNICFMSRGEYADPEIGVVHSFRINNKIIKAVACQTVIRNDICSKCCFVDTNICSNMRCFSSVREDDKSVIFKKIEL